MITIENVQEAKNQIMEEWGESSKEVIAECEKVERFDGKSIDFLAYCDACGGDWGAMLLTGIKRKWPKVWDAIPDHMGKMAFACLCDVLILCGVDTSA